jgi:hypothetical protein
MTVRLPDSDTRQRDMAYNALLTTMSNYVGNQSNYGNGNNTFLCVIFPRCFVIAFYHRHDVLVNRQGG